MKKLSIIIVLLILTGCIQESRQNIQVIETINNTTEQSIQFKPIEIETERIPSTTINREVTLTAVGDIMVHQWQMTRAYDSSTNTFDFSHAFQYIYPYLESGDYTIGNLETTFAGKDNGIRLEDRFYFHGYTEYPCFNTPEILAHNLKEAGFDLLSTANNHSLDSRSSGVLSTLDFLDEASLEYVGTYRSQEEKDQPFIKEIEGITFGFGSYTYGTNGLAVPKDMPYLVNTLDMYDEIKIENMAKEVSLLNDEAEVVVIMIHFGNEYHYTPNHHQKNIVDILFEAGADVILGSHPHVLQPIEIRKIEENGITRTGIVIYSLGNFLSSQRYTENRPEDTDIGVIMDIHFEKTYNDPVKITGISLTPTLTYWSQKEISVIPIIEFYENAENRPVALSAHDTQRLTYGYKNTIDHLTTYLDDPYNLMEQIEEHKIYIKVEEY
jgi:poly-gamma-glutamate synthesis protein (capsule biosynthesis protein)